MRIDLPSGNWVEVRDRLMADDMFAVSEAVTFKMEMNADGAGAAPVQWIPGGTEAKQRNALLGQIITDWSFAGIPVPEKNIAGAGILGSVLDIDDYNKLAEEVQPLMDKVTARPKTAQSGN